MNNKNNFHLADSRDDLVFSKQIRLTTPRYKKIKIHTSELEKKLH